MVTRGGLTCLATVQDGIIHVAVVCHDYHDEGKAATKERGHWRRTYGNEESRSRKWIPLLGMWKLLQISRLIIYDTINGS